MTITDCVKKIQYVLVNDLEIPIASAMAINEQLKLILMLEKEIMTNGSSHS